MVTKSDTARWKISSYGIDHLLESDQMLLIMFGIFQAALKNNHAFPTHAKVIEHSLQFKVVTTIRKILKKGGDDTKAFTQAAIAQEITICSFNSAPIATVDLIGKKLGSLISKTATNADKIKARTMHFRKPSYVFLERAAPNGRE